MVSGFFELPIPFDVLVAATDFCLPGYAPGFVDFKIEKQTPGSIVYTLSQEDLGDLGTVTARKLRSALSEVFFSGAPTPSNEQGIAYVLNFRRSDLKDEWAQILQSYLDQFRAQSAHPASTFSLFQNLSPDERRKRFAELHEQLSNSSSLLKAKREEHLRSVIEAYFSRLGQENIWIKQSEGHAAAAKVNLTATAAKIQTSKTPRDRISRLTSAIKSRFHWGYLLIGLVLGIIVFVTSLALYPEWAQSTRSILALIVAILLVVVSVLANFRKAFEPSSSSAVVKDSPTDRE